MAKVMVPQNRRVYNYNPRGSSTTTVTMRGDNPFERSLAGPEGLVRVQRGILPGMGFYGMGDDENTPSNPELFTLDPGGSAPAAVPSFVPADLTAFDPGASLPDSNTVAFPGDASAIMQTPTTMAPLTAPGSSPQGTPTINPIFGTSATPQTAPSATGVPHAGQTTAVTPAAAPSFWAGLTTSLINAAGTVAAPIVANQAAKSKAGAAASSAIKPFMPVSNVPAKKSNMTTYLVLGGIGIAAIIAITMIMKKKPA